MATRIFYKCMACGTMRNVGAFGINEDGLVANEVYDGHVGIQNIGGRGKCRWDRVPLSLDDARALRARYAAVVAQLDAEIAEATGQVA